jgi:hypothetical protein
MYSHFTQPRVLTPQEENTDPTDEVTLRGIRRIKT